MKSLLFAAAILTSAPVFASPAELFLGTWEGRAVTPAGESCSVRVEIRATGSDPELAIDQSIRCDEPTAGDRGEGWLLHLRADGMIAPEGIDAEHLPPATWSPTEIHLVDAASSEKLDLKRSNPMLDVVPSLQYTYSDRTGDASFELGGVLTRTK